jgi:hypothetical protein
MENATVSIALLNAILQYLGTQPYAQVFQLIQGIQKEVEAQSKPAAPAPEIVPES